MQVSPDVYVCQFLFELAKYLGYRGQALLAVAPEVWSMIENQICGKVRPRPPITQGRCSLLLTVMLQMLSELHLGVRSTDLLLVHLLPLLPSHLMVSPALTKCHMLCIHQMEVYLINRLKVCISMMKEPDCGYLKHKALFGINAKELDSLQIWVRKWFGLFALIPHHKKLKEVSHF